MKALRCLVVCTAMLFASPAAAQHATDYDEVVRHVTASVPPDWTVHELPHGMIAISVPNEVVITLTVLGSEEGPCRSSDPTAGSSFAVTWPAFFNHTTRSESTTTVNTCTRTRLGVVKASIVVPAAAAKEWEAVARYLSSMFAALAPPQPEQPVDPPKPPDDPPNQTDHRSFLNASFRGYLMHYR